MTIDTTPSRRAERPEEGHRPGPGADAPAAGADEAYRLVIDDIDRYRVIADGLVVGYVDVVGAVFVALAGPMRRRPRCTRLSCSRTRSQLS
ncbi:hypothetical protein HMPREF1529_01330 [Microbacterium sp. oral taxon 186 str. F0373]|uniref:hypothetical protein n=1 Tax=Microbacterium sp. oral taxon 186 TaxID=712383 RepID=UPI00034E7AEF|nr:hypothetical protein [Microbacterium sp. oral taxon 186]EPD84725.1 hypothetical protein HMPREF1529_01330 [Microbacterium sp. oral taxon 186 str. F0373]